MLEAGKQLLYKRCRDGHSPLSYATRLMGIKIYYNLAEECVDAIADFVIGVLPEDNLAPGSYYEAQKIVVGLNLPYEVIDVRIDNCMIYPVDYLDVMRGAYTNKKTGEFRIPLLGMSYLVESRKQEYLASQPLSDEGSSASTNLSRTRVNKWYKR